MRLFILSVFAFVLTFTVAFAETTVSRMSLTTEIKDREPVNNATEFKNDVGNVYCFTEIETDKYPTEITHIWLYEKNIEAEIKLPVKSNKWRTYTSKAILPSWKGNWKVEVYSQDGKLIKSVDFKVHE